MDLPAVFFISLVLFSYSYVICFNFLASAAVVGNCQCYGEGSGLVIICIGRILLGRGTAVTEIPAPRSYQTGRFIGEVYGFG